MKEKQSKTKGPDETLLLFFMLIGMFVAVPVMVTILVLVLSGQVTISYSGFAADTEGNLYIGKDARIDVVNPEGEFVRSFSTGTSRGYHFTFTVSDENSIYLSAGDFFCILDLEGNVLQEGEDLKWIKDVIPRNRPRNFTAPDGTQYERRLFFWRTRIYRLENGQRTLIYQMPLPDYIIRMVLFAFAVLATFLIPIFIFKWKKERGWKNPYFP